VTKGISRDNWWDFFLKFLFLRYKPLTDPEEKKWSTVRDNFFEFLRVLNPSLKMKLDFHYIMYVHRVMNYVPE